MDVDHPRKAGDLEHLLHRRLHRTKGKHALVGSDLLDEREDNAQPGARHELDVGKVYQQAWFGSADERINTLCEQAAGSPVQTTARGHDPDAANLLFTEIHT